MPAAATAATTPKEPQEVVPKFCGNCGGPANDWERCHVCGLVICPSCDIRGNQPNKPACSKHA